MAVTAPVMTQRRTAWWVGVAMMSSSLNRGYSLRRLSEEILSSNGAWKGSDDRMQKSKLQGLTQSIRAKN